MTRLQFGGCAGMNHYMFGVGAFIQEHYELDEELLIRTISGSNYVGMSMLSDWSVEGIWKLWSSRLDDLVKTRPWTGLYHMSAMVEQHTRGVVQACAHTPQRRDQHHIRVAMLDSMKTVWVCQYTGATDYVDTISTGAFIPGLCGRLWRRYRNHWCLDGGVRLPCTSRADPTAVRVSSLSINVLDNRAIGWLGMA